MGGGWQGSGIRCLFDPWIRDPGWVESQHLDLGSGIGDEQLGSYFLELRTIFLFFLGLKYLSSLMRIRDPGSVMEKGQIWDPGWKNV